MIKSDKSVSDLLNLRNLTTPGGRMIHPVRVIINFNAVENDISNNFYSIYKAVQSNLTELFF